MAAEQAFTTQRALFVPAAGRAALEALPHNKLGSSADGVWVLASDGAFFRLLEQGAGPGLLYFTRGDYEHAIRRLKPAEVEAVIRKRRNDWSPNAINDAVYRVFQDERRCLSLLAAAREGREGDARRRLAVLAEETLVLLAGLTGEGRYDEVKPSDMLLFTLEGEARLLAERELARGQAERGGDAAEARRLERLMEAQKESAAEIQAALAERGRSEFATALPYSDVDRVLLVTPREQRVIDGLTKDQVFVEWRGGVVFPWRVRKLQDLRAPGRTVATLYLDRGEYLEALSELTRAQLERDWAERLAGGGAEGPAAVGDHLNGLLLEQHLLRRSLLGAARRHDARLTPVITPQVEREAQALLDALARQPTWLSRRPQSGGEAVIMLRQSVREAAEDATAFAEWSRCVRQTALRDRFLKVAVVTAGIRARAEQLPSSNP